MRQSRTSSMKATLWQSNRTARTQCYHLKPEIPAWRRFTSDASIKQENKKPPPSPPRFDPSKAPIQIKIPGPAWLWAPLKPLNYPLAAYNRAQRSRPYLTQLLTTLVIFFTGDLFSQYIQRPVPALSVKDQAAPTEAPPATTQSAYDPMRSIRALIIGGTISIPSYRWFMYVAKLWPTLAHFQSLALKVALQCFLFAPVISTYFFSMQSLLAGDGGDSAQGKVEAAWVRVKDTVPRSWLTGLWFWPFVTAFSFSLVPPMNRSIFNGVAGVCWQTYLGLLNSRAKVGELGGGEKAQTADLTDGEQAPA